MKIGDKVRLNEVALTGLQFDAYFGVDLIVAGPANLPGYFYVSRDGKVPKTVEEKIIVRPEECIEVVS